MVEKSRIYGIDCADQVDFRKIRIPVRNRKDFVEALYFDFKIEFVVKFDRVICHCMERSGPLGRYRYESTKEGMYAQLNDCLDHVIKTITKNVPIQATTAA